MKKVLYTCQGKYSACGTKHKTIRAAAACCKRYHACRNAQGINADRKVYHLDGTVLSKTEYEANQAWQHLLTCGLF